MNLSFVIFGKSLTKIIKMINGNIDILNENSSIVNTAADKANSTFAFGTKKKKLKKFFIKLNKFQIP